MEKSIVFYTDFHATIRENMLQKTEKLLQKAGFDLLPLQNRFAALKIHFGEPGNLAYLRPNYAKVVADMVKARGGKPFLTDCNTLYVGRRKNALEHLDAAYENGYNPFATGCQVLIADGLKGTDEALVPLNDGTYVKEAKIGRAVMDADVMISINHFKAHENTGIGGAIKNIGMGCGSRAGKMEMHSSGKPSVSQVDCVGCGSCQKICAHSAIVLENKKARIEKSRCVGCGRCIGVCPADAIAAEEFHSNDILCCKMAEYAAAVLRGRPSFHISFVMDVSPFCDCHAENDIPIVGNVGIFASFDPVALDCACAEAVNRQPVMAGSLLAKNGVQAGEDYFHALHPETDWRVCMQHAQKLGLGHMDYELREIR